MVVLAGNASTITDFENQLPYAALGMSRPAPRAVRQSTETPIPVAKLLADFADDRIGAGQKYADKPLLYSGRVKIMTSGLTGAVLVGLHVPLNRDSVTAKFPAPDAAVTQLKVDQEITFRCSVVIFKDTKDFALFDNCKLE